MLTNSPRYATIAPSVLKAITVILENSPFYSNDFRLHRLDSAFPPATLKSEKEIACARYL